MRVMFTNSSMNINVTVHKTVGSQDIGDNFYYSNFKPEVIKKEESLE